MKYVLIVRSNHLTGGYKALEFAKYSISSGHKFTYIYFLFDGALLANKYIELPSDEPNIAHAWRNFAAENKVSLKVCPASANRRGITNDNIAPGFEFGTIGQLAEECNNCDKVHCL